jgi:SAM-dependent methyltransferase
MYYRELVAAVERLGLESRIKFLGQRSDVPALMNAADIYCQPNIGPEPFGLAFIEALSAGLPIVTTAMGGPLEIVTPGCGALTLPSPLAVAAAIEAYVDSDEKRKAASGAGPLRARDLCNVAVRTREFAAELADLAKPASFSDVGERALLSKGHSSGAILSVVASALREKEGHMETVVDLGCGGGDSARYLDGMYDHYLGCDVVRYDAFPNAKSIQFKHVDLNRTPYPVDSASARVVVSVETIEHIENPRALVREMARIVRPGGLIVVTTPNQLSLMSKLYLVARNEFHAFQEAPGLYPAHITALVEEDLIRIARESGLVDVEIRYTNRGRIPLTGWYWPRRAGMRGQWFSDNVVMLARRP